MAVMTAALYAVLTWIAWTTPAAVRAGWEAPAADPALLAAVLDPMKETERLDVLPGSIPDLADPPRGCRFHPRCPFAEKVCAEIEPELVEDPLRAPKGGAGQVPLTRPPRKIH